MIGFAHRIGALMVGEACNTFVMSMRDNRRVRAKAPAVYAAFPIDIISACRFERGAKSFFNDCKELIWD